MGDEITVFKYETLDVQIAAFLRQKERNIRTSYERMVDEVGTELLDAQTRLSGNNQYDGVFERWYTSLGFSKRTVYNYIGYVSVVQQVHEQKFPIDVETLPKKLVYEIGAKSSESTPAKAQAKSEVLNGDIDTLKAYRERIAELESQAKQATEKAEKAESARQIAEEIYLFEKLSLNRTRLCAYKVDESFSENCRCPTVERLAGTNIAY